MFTSASTHRRTRFIATVVNRSGSNGKMQHRDCQANNKYKKTVISLFNLGLQILRKDAKSIMGADLIRILRHLEDYTMKILKT